ncbi:MAG: FtsQ-type POTRA domain-containing protein [Deltaproteobacteria bacterium]|nr:FtsQ-type POTRA domain-containing protein [Deltaproteobacteria bacterium]
MKKKIGITGLLIALSLLLFVGRKSFRILFTLREVVIASPTAHLTEAEIIRLSGVEMESNLLTLPLSQLEKNLRRFSWVQDVSLLKRYPGRLYIEVKEQQPLAIIQIDHWYYLNKNGEIFRQLTADDSHDFPILTGVSEKPASLHQAVSFIEQYQKAGPSSFFGISELHWDNKQGFSVQTLRPAFRILFGKEKLADRLKKWESVGQSLIALSGKKQPLRVDLTYEKRVFVKVKPIKPERGKQNA